MLSNTLIHGNLEKLERAKFSCNCGMNHALNVQQFGVVNTGVGAISYYIKRLGGMAHVVLEQGSAGVCEQEIIGKISQRLRNGISIISKNEKDTCARIIAEAPKETSVIVAAGGRAVCQTAKYVAEALALPLIFVSVLMDDDDMLSPRSLLWHEGKLQNFDGRTPDVVIISVTPAWKLAQSDIKSAVSLLAANMLFCYENMFNAAAIGAQNCDKLDLLISTAVADGLTQAGKKAANKNLVECLMTSLMRVSVAKAMNYKGVYDTSFDALCRFLEAETGVSRGIAAGAAFAAIIEIFEQILINSNVLSVGQANSEGVPTERDNGLTRGYSLGNIAANKAVLAAELDAVKTTVPLVRALLTEAAFLTKDALAPGLKASVKRYGFEGLLKFGADSGLI